MKTLTMLIFAAFVAIITGCGGGGDSVSPPPVTPPVPTCINASQTWNAGMGRCVYPMGVSAVGANQLPAGCVDPTQQCFKDASKTVATGVVYNKRPLAVAYFKNQASLWNVMVLYGDDGTAVNVPGNTVAGGTATELDWTRGMPFGVIIHKKADNVCAAVTFDTVYQQVFVAAVACPV